MTSGKDTIQNEQSLRTITYTPIDTGFAFDSFRSDLVAVDWAEGWADFILPADNAYVLRVEFARRSMIRALDEVAFSLESNPNARIGLMPGHFAYQVEGAPFGSSVTKQSWERALGIPLKHYCFVTGDGCLDVLSDFPPRFSLLPLDPHTQFP